MKVSEGFIFKKILGTGVIVPIGEESRDFKGMVTLNETGSFLWEQLTEPNADRDTLIAALIAEYEVDEETASRDVDAFIVKLREAGLLAE